MDIPNVLKKDEGITIILFVGVLITILDLYTSYIFHHLGYIEANPIMNYLIVNFGLWFFVIINFMLSILTLSFLTWGSLEKLEGKPRYIPLLIYCVIRGAAVVNNVLVIL